MNIKMLYPDYLLIKPSKGHTDREEDFRRNLKTQPDNWYYRTHPVEYKYNSNNYRCPEWKDINWSESWVVLGCSHVEGVALDESDTLSNRISEIIGDPVINLGIGGSGPDATLFNSLRLIDSGIRPKGVILLVGEFAWARLTLFAEDKAKFFGPWQLTPNRLQRLEPLPLNRHHSQLSIEKDIDLDFDDFYIPWLRSPLHAETHSYMCDRGATAAWKAENVPTFHFNIERQLPRLLDRARDLLHPGRETIKSWAKTIAEQLKNKHMLSH